MDIENSMDIDDDVPSAFTEKKWGREEEGKARMVLVFEEKNLLKKYS